jgi:acyl-[acyl-carrier-protein]-phospholipid O-acyltransferase/long-chain-fatty-acid--[acyl-carrier-protein] ligase
LRNGEIVCIFAEGQITRTGQLLPFRRGLERIMKGVEVPIIPVNLDGVWGSIFSFERGRFLWKMPRRIPYRVTVSFGRPMAPTSPASEVRAAVQELHAAAFEARKSSMKTLDRAFLSTARRRPWRFFMADGKTPRVSFGAALNKTVYIARRLRRHVGEQPMVGVLLPPSVGGALANYALMLMGRVPVNLNYTSSNETIASCAKQCDLEVVISSRAFLERLPNLEVPARTLLLEDVLRGPRFAEKLIALALACADVFRFAGPVNIQCRMVDGSPRVFEINPRFSGGIPLTIAAGADFPAMLVDLALGRPVAPRIGAFRSDLWMSSFEASLFLEPAQLVLERCVHGEAGKGKP